MAIGPLFTAGMGGWVLYDILKATGLLGASGDMDRNLTAAAQAFQASLDPATGASDELLNQRYLSESLAGAAGMAKATGQARQSFQRSMSADLSGLLGGKNETLARASMAPPDMQSMMMDFASMGGM